MAARALSSATEATFSTPEDPRCCCCILEGAMKAEAAPTAAATKSAVAVRLGRGMVYIFY
jgi:hypothetical protein